MARSKAGCASKVVEALGEDFVRRGSRPALSDDHWEKLYTAGLTRDELLTHGFYTPVRPPTLIEFLHSDEVLDAAAELVVGSGRATGRA